MVNIKDFGAQGDGNSDDRAAIQAALNAGAGGSVFVPNGRYLVGKGAGYWGVNVPAGTTVVGESRLGVLFQQAPVDPNVRLFQVEAEDVILTTMTIDGNSTFQPSPGEHRAGVFAHGAKRLVIKAVTAIGFTGDGIYVHIGTDDFIIDDVLCGANKRNGATLGGGTIGGLVTNSQFISNDVQQLDSEPGAGTSVDGLKITGCLFDPGESTQYVLTIAGTGGAARSKNWVVENNRFWGAVEIIGSNDVTFRHNTIRQSANSAALMIYHGNDRVLVQDNDITLTGPLGPQVIGVIGTGIGQASDRVIISRNRISSGVANAFGIRASCVRSLEVYDNLMTGNGIPAPFIAGVYARSTAPGEDIKALVVRRNRISGFGSAGVSTAQAPGVIRMVDVSDNVFDDTTGHMAGWSLDALDVRQSGNLLLGNVVQPA